VHEKIAQRGGGSSIADDLLINMKMLDEMLRNLYLRT
jgi:hypothetical protein